MKRFSWGAGPRSGEPGLRRPSRRSASTGFTLLEAILTVGLVAGVAATLLHGLATALQVHSRTQLHWGSTIELWNRACLARIQRSDEGEPFQPLPESRPIRRILIEGAGSAQAARWEVLRAEK